MGNAGRNGQTPISTNDTKAEAPDWVRDLQATSPSLSGATRAHGIPELHRRGPDQRDLARRRPEVGAGQQPLRGHPGARRRHHRSPAQLRTSAPTSPRATAPRWWPPSRAPSWRCSTRPTRRPRRQPRLGRDDPAAGRQRLLLPHEPRAAGERRHATGPAGGAGATAAAGGGEREHHRGPPGLREVRPPRALRRPRAGPGWYGGFALRGDGCWGGCRDRSVAGDARLGTRSDGRRSR